MKRWASSVFIASYLACCIALGGSAQNPWTNLALQLGGIALIGWAAIVGNPGQKKRISAINLLIICALLLVMVQLVPLPVNIWTRLPAREEIVRGLSTLGYPLRPLPIAEMPHEAVLALFSMIPAIASFIAVERLSPSPLYIAAAIVGGMIAAIFVGALQVASGPNSWAYFYEIHNSGAIGFFANSNHMGTLFLVAIPMAAALIVSGQSKRRKSRAARYAIGFSIAVLIAVGIVLNGSRAALGLSVPVIIASAAIFHATARWRGLLLGASLISLIAGIGIIVGNPIASPEFSTSNSASVGIRGEVWRTTLRAISDNFPVGTGLASFANVYHHYENPDQVGAFYVNHAHNEYLELALELGLGGVLLILFFLAWWTKITVRVWASAYSSAFGRAATIATAAVIVHSAVDFPVRTAAISSIFAACIALMAQSAGPSTDSFSSKRHLVLG